MHLFILMVLSVVTSISVSQAQEQTVSGTLKWEAPLFMSEETTAVPPGFISHYVVYTCDANILHDPNGIEPVCIGQMQKVEIREELTTKVRYTPTTSSGTLYARVAAVSIIGTHSKLSQEVSLQWDYRRTGPPTNVEFVIDVIPATRQ